MAWYESNSGSTTHPVGVKQPNKFGLYDMQGNVWEWCMDGNAVKYYSESPSADPMKPGTPFDERLRRGDGQWGKGV